jgi:hypothetical protein
MNTLYKIQKSQSVHSDVRDSSAVESALFHIPTALNTTIPHMAVSFSAISIRDITALLSSPQLNIHGSDRKKLISFVKTLTKRIHAQIETVMPRKTDDIFSQSSINKTRKNKRLFVE